MRICLAWLMGFIAAHFILLGCSPIAAEPAFRSGFVGIPVPIGAEGLCAADFDHDGDKDLAVACRLSDVVSVLLLTSNGDLDSRVDYPVGDEPRHLVAADLDLDGNLDLISANYGSDEVSVLRGDSDGRFMPRRDYPTDRRPIFVVVTDDLDLIVTCQGANTLVLLFAVGDGTFQDSRSMAVSQEPSQVVAGDLNGDEKVDLVVASSRSLSVYLGLGYGYFQHFSDHSNFTGTLALRDLDGDGNLDLVAASDLARVLRGNGNGEFGSPTGYRSGGPPAFIVLDLLDDDPWPDLVLANQFANRITILWGLPGGAFEPARDFQGGHNPAHPVIADLTGDGRADIATTGGLLQVYVFEANGDRTFGRGLDLPPVGPHARSVSIVDMDSDGRNEVASIGPWSWDELVVHHQNGNGGFDPPSRTPIARSRGPVAFADFDTDGRLDLLCRSSTPDPSNQPLLVQLGTVGGAFGPATALPVFNPSALEVEDFDRDGNLDILVVGDRIDLAAGHGDGSFEVRTSVAIDGRALVVDDLNADGVLDAVVVGQDGPGGFYRVLLGNGAGLFTVLERHATVYDPSAVGLGHLDDDAVLDLVVASREFNQIGIHRGVGAGGLRQRPRWGRRGIRVHSL